MRQGRTSYRTRGWTVALIISSHKGHFNHTAPHRFQMVMFGMN